MIIDGNIRATIHTSRFAGPWLFGTATYGIEAYDLQNKFVALVPFDHVNEQQRALDQAVTRIRRAEREHAPIITCQRDDVWTTPA